MITPQSKISIPEDILFHELDGEAVLLNLVTGKYYGLDPVGTRMWVHLTRYDQLEAVQQALLEEYDVEPEKLQGDLFKLIEQLAERGLVKIDDA